MVGAPQRRVGMGFYKIMTIRDLLQELVRCGELDTHVVIETPNGDYNVARVESQYNGENTVYLQIDS